MTLGVDSNGDGIPDSWETAFMATIGVNLPLSSLHANSVLTSDGLTLRQQYLFGTYPFNPSQPCLVTFLGFSGALPVLQFPTVTGHSYTVLGSSDAINWAPVPFQLPGDAPGGVARSYYYALGIRTLQVYATPPANPPKAQYYRILVQ